jgi:predicted dehydrogenase
MSTRRKNEKIINAAVIGAGGRGIGMTNVLCKNGENVRVRAVFDPDKKQSQKLKDTIKQQDAVICGSYEEALNIGGVDWALVFSPNHCHKDNIVTAFKAGQNVFAEKPLATTIEDCQAICDAHKKSGKLFATGFVLRYSPMYRKVKELLDAGKIGKVLSIDANENITPAHGSYIMKNWRRLTKYSGPHILEKCCHDLDLINWFAGALPSKVASFGGCDFFTPANSHYFDKYKNKAGESLFEGWHDPHGEKSPFTTEKDIMDNQVAIIQYRNNIRVMFQATLSNAIPERRMYMSGTEGTLIAELYSSTLRVKRIDEEAETIYRSIGMDGHGGGDTIIMKELYDSMVSGAAPKCGGNEGLEGSVLALAIDEARAQGKVFDLEPVWKKLGK